MDFFDKTIKTMKKHQSEMKKYIRLHPDTRFGKTDVYRYATIITQLKELQKNFYDREK